MRFIKKFEDIGHSPLPITSQNILTNFYSCDDCDALWKEFNEESNTCKYCGSHEIEDLPEDEWYELVNSRLDKDEIEKMQEMRKKENETLVDLLSLKNKNNYGN